MAAKQLKLLIAEDDRDLCQAYTQAIREFNGKIQVKIATDGSQAANLVRTERFDGLILDVRLPTMNGLQVGQIARDSELNKKTPIIVISGSLDQESHQRAGGLGRVRVIEKPIDSSQFIAALSEYVPSERSPGFDPRVIEMIRRSVQTALESQVEPNLVVAEPVTIPPVATVEVAGLVFLYSVIIGSVTASLRLCLSSSAIGAIAKGRQGLEWDDGIVGQTLIEIAPRMAEAVTKAMAKKSEKSGLSMRCHLVEILYGSGSNILARAGTQVITMAFQLDGQPVHADLVLNAANPGAL
jgi:CheY-like chemotaxis protein